MTRPFLLLTNDDGIHAPGLKHLWHAVHEYVDIAIVAPSSKNRSRTFYHMGQPLGHPPSPLGKRNSRLERQWHSRRLRENGSISSLGAPPPSYLVWYQPGSNSGRTALYSGTVGGVIEGAMKGIPGIAFSFSDYDITPSVDVTKNYIFPLMPAFPRNTPSTGNDLEREFPLYLQRNQGRKACQQGKAIGPKIPTAACIPMDFPTIGLGAAGARLMKNRKATWLF